MGVSWGYLERSCLTSVYVYIIDVMGLKIKSVRGEKITTGVVELTSP